MWSLDNRPEALPWYRAAGYKGNMKEAEKRSLDAFRMQAKHPAATSHDLPEEVQAYIGRLEMEVYDLKQDSLANIALAFTLAGAAWLYLNYNGLSAPMTWTYIFGVLLMVLPWIIYQRRWKRNAEEFLPKEPAPDSLNPTDEGIRQEWELSYIANLRERDRL